MDRRFAELPEDFRSVVGGIESVTVRVLDSSNLQASNRRFVDRPNLPDDDANGTPVQVQHFKERIGGDEGHGSPLTGKQVSLTVAGNAPLNPSGHRPGEVDQLTVDRFV